MSQGVTDNGTCDGCIHINCPDNELPCCSCERLPKHDCWEPTDEEEE